LNKGLAVRELVDKIKSMSNEQTTKGNETMPNTTNNKVFEIRTKTENELLVEEHSDRCIWSWLSAQTGSILFIPEVYYSQFCEVVGVNYIQGKEDYKKSENKESVCFSSGGKGIEFRQGQYVGEGKVKMKTKKFKAWAVVPHMNLQDGMHPRMKTENWVQKQLIKKGYELVRA
jgi:hypothetical protein